MAAEDRPALKRGDNVIVTEDGLRPWRGEVRGLKWSRTSGWWIEILRAGDDRLTYSVQAAYVKRGEGVSAVAP